MHTRLLLPLLLVVSSCSVQATLTLGTQGGEVNATFALSKPAMAAWSNLRELDPTLPVNPLAPGLLRQNLGPQGKVFIKGDQTEVTLSVPDLQNFLPLRREESQWEGTIDRATVRRWLDLTSWAGSPVVDSLVPSANATISEAEYRDLLVYLLGPGTPEAAARTLVDASVVELRIIAPRPLKAAPGAVSVSGKTALYRWPLVRVLALQNPLPIRLVF